LYKLCESLLKEKILFNSNWFRKSYFNQNSWVSSPNGKLYAVKLELKWYWYRILLLLIENFKSDFAFFNYQ
jgi:hypothetical protein